MIECPHCHTVVLPQKNGNCPACMKDTNSPPEIQTSKIPLRRGCAMPDVCYKCGDYSHRSVKVAFTEPRHEEAEESSSGLWILSMIFGLLGFLIVALAKLFQALMSLGTRMDDRGTTVAFRIRQCRSCGRRGEPYPHRVWFDEGEMDFVVHPTFADEFAAMNRDFDAASGRWATEKQR